MIYKTGYWTIILCYTLFAALVAQLIPYDWRYAYGFACGGLLNPLSNTIKIYIYKSKLKNLK